MKASWSALLPLLRSQLQGELLAWLYLHPESESSVSDLAARFGVSQPTVSREADRLASAGLVLERRHGNLRLLRANLNTVVAGPLAELLSVTYGPRAVLGELLSTVDGVKEAYIYGSWASRYRGIPGSVPHDIDVVVVGETDEDDLYEVAKRAEQVLGREVNARRVSSRLWERRSEDPFLASVLSRPVVKLDLGDKE